MSCFPWKTLSLHPLRRRLRGSRNVRISSASPWKTRRPGGPRKYSRALPAFYIFLQVAFKILEVGFFLTEYKKLELVAPRNSLLEFQIVSAARFWIRCILLGPLYKADWANYLQIEWMTCRLSELPVDWANYVGIGVGERQWVCSAVAETWYACTRVVVEVWAFIVLRKKNWSIVVAYVFLRAARR